MNGSQALAELMGVMDQGFSGSVATGGCAGRGLQVALVSPELADSSEGQMIAPRGLAASGPPGPAARTPEEAPAWGRGASPFPGSLKRGC